MAAFLFDTRGAQRRGSQLPHHHLIIQHQLRQHHRLAGIAQLLPLGAEKPERHLEAVGHTRQQDGVDDADVKVWLRAQGKGLLLNAVDRDRDGNGLGRLLGRGCKLCA